MLFNIYEKAIEQLSEEHGGQLPAWLMVGSALAVMSCLAWPVSLALAITGLYRSRKKHFAVIFEHELAGWCTDPAFWPEKRTYREFKKWFEVEFHSLVLELGDGGILVE